MRHLSIFALRDIARNVGVKCPTILKKEQLIDQIMKIMSGEVVPEIPKSRQGRPPKNRAKITISKEDEDLNAIFKDKEVKIEFRPEEAKWLFCDKAERNSMYDDKFDFRDGEGYVNLVNDRLYIFPFEKNFGQDYAILLPKAVEPNPPLRSGDFVKCLYKSSENCRFKICNKIKNASEFEEERPYFDNIKRVIPSQPLEILSKRVKLGDKIIIKVNNFTKYPDLVRKINLQVKDCKILNLVLDSLVEDDYSGVETMRSYMGDSTSKNTMVVNIATDRVKRLVEEGESVVLCINELLKIVKYQNFLYGYDYGSVRTSTFSSVLNLLKLAGAYENGSTVTIIAIIKNDKVSQCGNYLLNELENMNCKIYDEC